MAVIKAGNMDVILDRDTGSVYIRLARADEGKDHIKTNQFAKFGMYPMWDGSGKLLGVEFRGDGSTAKVQTVSSFERESVDG